VARSTFFSFHYDDIWRVNEVRNSWVTVGGQTAGFLDRSLWEEAETKGDTAIKDLIDQGLKGTSVTAVLIGAKTARRRYVRYEIEQSIKRGNGLIGIHLAKLRDKQGKRARRGTNPLNHVFTTIDGEKVRLSEIYRTYDWVDDDGFSNLKKWVEDAAVAAGRPPATQPTEPIWRQLVKTAAILAVACIGLAASPQLVRLLRAGGGR